MLPDCSKKRPQGAVCVTMLSVEQVSSNVRDNFTCLNFECWSRSMARIPEKPATFSGRVMLLLPVAGRRRHGRWVEAARDCDKDQPSPGSTE